jgi:hypothetical protein
MVVFHTCVLVNVEFYRTYHDKLDQKRPLLRGFEQRQYY